MFFRGAEIRRIGHGQYGLPSDLSYSNNPADFGVPPFTRPNQRAVPSLLTALRRREYNRRPPATVLPNPSMTSCCSSMTDALAI